MHHPQAVLCDVALLLFLLFAANYQPPISYSREKSWAFGAENSERARCSFAVLRCLLSVKDYESLVREKQLDSSFNYT